MIDTQAIRSKILNLAMRGQLTEQYENETVDFVDEVSANAPYSVPSNWKWVKLASIITKDVGGGTPSKSVEEYWKNGTIPWMSVKDFSSAKNGILEDTIDHITQAGLENSASNLIDVNAIIVCMRMALGKIVKLKRPMAINQDLRAIWLNKCVDRDYFVFYYSTLKVEGYGMTVAGINKKQLMAYMMPLPPLAEQQRIVEKIGQVFSVLDTIDALQARHADNLAALKAKLIDAAIRGKLTEQLPQDGTAEELYQHIQAEKQALIKAGKIRKEKPLPEVTPKEAPFDIPANWKWVRVGSVAEVASGTTPKAIELSSAGTIPYFKVSDMNVPGNETYMNHAINFITDGYAGKIFPAGTTIFPKNGGAALTNKRRILTIPSAVDLNTGGCTPVIGEMARWIKLFMETVDFGRMDTGSNIPTVNATNLKKRLMVLPPLAEQQRIVARLDEVLKIIEQ